LIAKPITRNKIITEKLLAGLLNILVFNMVTLVSSITMVGYFNHGDSLTVEIVKLMIGMFIIQLIFLLMGSAIAAYGKNSKTSTPVAIVTVLVFLMIAKIADMSNSLDFLKWFTPIKYYEAEIILGRYGFSSPYLILSLLIVVLLTFITYRFYQKRDLKV
jgi:ABC-2 type transport system permease protein